MIFDFWKKKAETEQAEVDNNVVPLYNYTTPTIVPPAPKVVHYTVGTTTDGQTVLKVGDGYTVTLTMNDPAVRQLIRLLEATLTDEVDNEED